MLPPSPPLISPPENLNYVVLITQFMTHFTRPQFMFQWISVAPPAVWIWAPQFLGFVFSDFGFIVLVSLTIYFPIGFVSPAPRFPIFAPHRSLLARAEPGSLWRWWKINGFCPIAAGRSVRTFEHRNIATALFVLNRHGDSCQHRQAAQVDSQFHRCLEIEQNLVIWKKNSVVSLLRPSPPFFECVNIWFDRSPQDVAGL